MAIKIFVVQIDTKDPAASFQNFEQQLNTFLSANRSAKVRFFETFVNRQWKETYAVAVVF